MNESKSLLKFVTFSGCVLAVIFAFPLFAANKEIYVRTTTELNSALIMANKVGNISILLEDGVYQINHRLSINKDNIHIRSASGNPRDVILRGRGMVKRIQPEVLIDVSASNVTISGITLEQAANHLIQVRAEANADNFTLSNAILRDAYEQLLKVSGGRNKHTSHSDKGLIFNTIFEYSAGIGPQFYIGGIDAHRARQWQIQNNQFKNIASPSKSVAEHAIHFWNDSSDNQVTSNTIINCDRGIGFGLGNVEQESRAGSITDNTIIHTATYHPYADAGIILESSSLTVVKNNTVLLFNGYPNAIEYRFPRTSQVVISGNTVNKRIRARDGGRAVVKDNIFLRQ